ncbi:spindle pole body formation-associated protein-domain-containing protein [Bombardia bombarda]|uniref:Spindle pole body formation-associated protein-domain-containing protein n=1 Tax=Bombardia bombarda TaxID=252184 RepID=A0AA39XLK3_9PEZI|nr:spindle pole body formation-associated protein-domain-containing protein [Bombardia bombarda]
MLSWALKRNNSNSTVSAARDAPGPDDTLIDAPDTPAPVFALRALRTTLFGTPAARNASERAELARATTAAKNEKKAAAAGGKKNGNAVVSLPPEKSPIKPPGILLTPGTATARRKRVSFGHDVKEGAVVPETSTSGLPDECPGKLPSPWVGGRGGEEKAPKTRLTVILENSRTDKPKAAATTATGTDINASAGATPGPQAAAKETEDAWEEVDDDELDRDPDITVDLNEPHSRSGRYWKSYFEEYHADAKAEMEKLVKYKQLAKSYAKKKDSEAIDLNQKLKEEQEKVRQMERKVAEMGRHVSLSARNSGGAYDKKLMDELTKQTALAVEYKVQVDELEALLQPDDVESDGKAPRQRSRIASPRTQNTLYETQRELRRARSQVRELDKLREERDRLRSELRFAEQRANKLVDENRKLSGDISQNSSKVQDLEKKLAESRNEAAIKDSELKSVRADYEKLKDDAKARYTEAHQVLHKKNDKISELQEEIGSLRNSEGGVESRWATRVKNLEAKLKTSNENIKTAPSDRETALKFLETAEEESTQLLNELNELRRVSVQKGLIAPVPSASTRARQQRQSMEGLRHQRSEDKLSSQGPRDRIEVDMVGAGGGGRGRRHSTVLGDRANMQDNRRSTSVMGHHQQLNARQSLEDAAASSRPLTRAGTERAPRTSTSTTSLRHAASRASLYEMSVPKAAREPPTRKPPARPTSSRGTNDDELFNGNDDTLHHHIDLVEDNFARLGGPAAAVSAGNVTATRDNSTMWSMNTSRAALPADRKAAAIARLQRKKAERIKAEQRVREQQRDHRDQRGVERNKENLRPY